MKARPRLPYRRPCYRERAERAERCRPALPLDELVALDRPPLDELVALHLLFLMLLRVSLGWSFNE